MRYVLLADHPEVVPEVASLMQAVWPDHYGPAGPGDAVADVTRRTGKAAVPLAVVAMDAGGAVMGTGALDVTSFGANPAEGPWVVGLCVAPAWRGQGVAGRIVAMLEAEATRLGHRHLYTAAHGAVPVFAGRGWRLIRDVPDGAATWHVLRWR